MTGKRSSSRRSRLEREIEELRELAFSSPDDSVFPDATYLEIERDSVVRARVLLDCGMLEELMALIIMDHILADCSKWNEIEYFGRIKKYYVFYDDILGRLPARHKMSVVRKFIRIPKSISKTIGRMLALRDVFAHVYTLDYTKTRDLDYKGLNILSKAGFKSYIEDATDVIAFLVKKAKIL